MGLGRWRADLRGICLPLRSRALDGLDARIRLGPRGSRGLVSLFTEEWLIQ